MGIKSYFVNEIAVLVKTETRDSVGQMIESWVVDFTFMGVINPLSGNDSYISKTRDIISSHAMYCPITVNVNERNRILFQDQTYDVVFVANPMNKNKYLKVYLGLVE